MAFLAARQPEGVGLVLELMPSPERWTFVLCAFRPRHLLDSQLDLGHASPALSILRLSQEIAESLSDQRMAMRRPSNIGPTRHGLLGK